MIESRRPTDTAGQGRCSRVVAPASTVALTPLVSAGSAFAWPGWRISRPTRGKGGITKGVTAMLVLGLLLILGSAALGVGLLYDGSEAA